MKITKKPYLLKRRKKPNGEIPVYIRITQNRNYSLLSTDISIEDKHWDGRNKWKKWIKSSHPSAKAWNKKISDILTKIDKIIEQAGDNIDRKQVVALMQGDGKDHVYEYGVDVAEKLSKDGKYYSYKQMKAAVSKFKQFKGRDVRFSEVTPQMLNNFQYWMKTELGNHPNTIVKTIGRVKAVFNDAYKKDITTNLPFNDPKFKKEESVETKKRALSIEQIEAIGSLELEGRLWHTRNYFMFSFWNAGIRFTDLTFLRWENIKDGRLVYQMGKNQKQKDIMLLPEAERILDLYRDDSKEKDDFIFPILPKQKMTVTGYKKKAASQNVLINRDLKEIQKLAGIQTNISFHISRHSFARWAKGNDMSMDFIGKALAHSKRETTERYIDSLSEYNIDDEMRRLAETRNGSVSKKRTKS